MTPGLGLEMRFYSLGLWGNKETAWGTFKRPFRLFWAAVGNNKEVRRKNIEATVKEEKVAAAAAEETGKAKEAENVKTGEEETGKPEEEEKGESEDEEEKGDDGDGSDNKGMITGELFCALHDCD
ncbi:hypothetical protein SLEP1_g1911 [Rubroshorea leprosula]|uniref:Uncharacterized protein n=1 Tax=Rubroshorea leprosula TaxID=152421 RepID=A0AAV5HQQ7_9ROSI|nr:hypothetical protein SLEP1_g1911 [Rubroshorea leprosula]